MDAGDIFQLKVSQIAPSMGDEGLNVFFYRLISGEFVLDDFIGAFVLNVVLPMRTVQHSSIEYRYIELANIFNLDEFAVRSWDAGELVGLAGGAAPAPANAFNFTLRRTSRAVRNGAKRLLGVPSGEYVGGVLTSGGFIASMNNVANAFGETLTEPISDAVLSPCIVKRVKTANPDYPATSKYPFKYSLPTALLSSVSTLVASVSFSNFASTQVSRKTNR